MSESGAVETLPPQARPTRFELFRSADYVVRAVTGFSDAVCVVSFDSYTDERTLDRGGFGERFFEDRRIDAIHVVPRANDWYQHEDILAIASAIAAVAARYERVYAYGSSMGGYAAIRLGGLIGATAAIALSPQYSIDPRLVPFENRWTGDANRIRFAIERSGRDAFAGFAYVAYDPTDLDGRHVALLRARTRLIEIPIARGGHPVTGFLAEAGLLPDLVLGIVRENLDIPALLAQARVRRKRTAQFWAVLAERTREPRARVAFAKRAVSLAPGDVGYEVRYARALALNEDYAAAEVLFTSALNRQPTNPVLLYNFSEMLEWRGDTKGALEVAERLVAAHPEAHIFDHRVAHLANRRRFETVMSGVGDLARHRVTRPIRALYRRIWERNRPPGEPAGDGRQPVEILVTVTPSPPPFVHSWARHADLMRALPTGPVDLLLVGDSHIQYWPPAAWGGRSTFNFGIAADKTQHALWRLLALADGSVKARDAVLLIGVNNLGADDTPTGIAAGVSECAREIGRVAPDARLHVVAVPPCGENMDFRASDRRRANALIRSRWPSQFVDSEVLLQRPRNAGAAAAYQDDFIHLSDAGYAALTEALLRRMATAAP